MSLSVARLSENELGYNDWQCWYFHSYITSFLTRSACRSMLEIELSNQVSTSSNFGAEVKAKLSQVLPEKEEALKDHGRRGLFGGSLAKLGSFKKPKR